MEEEVVLQAGDADDWAYKTEGAANLILTYTGSSPSMLGKVLRVKKVLKDEAEPAPSSEQLLWSELIDSVKQDCLPQAYAQLMSQHLGANHVDGGVRARVPKEFLNIVAKNVLSSRPIGRVHASAIDTTADSALLISDHSLFSGMPSGSSCIAVEIKAKCGFLPSSEYISKENSIKKQVTRYKMHQHLKFHQGQISKTSDYDPLDLFSGSKERIRTAIKSFFSTPQNNFRIFVNGSLGFGGMGGGADTVHPNETDKCLEDLSKVSGLQLSDLIELLSEAILQSRVFDQLLATQKLDDHDIEGAIHLYYSVLSQPCLVCNNNTDVELLQKYDALHSLSSEKSCMIVRDFLIAATAKDCSLMMCFRPKKCETTDSKYDSVFLKSVNQTYDYKAYFVDLDVKPLDKMPHYFKLDQKIVKFYTKNGEAGGVPCDSSKGGGTASSRVKLSWKGAKQGVTKGGKKGKDEKGVAESSGTTNEKREREMENMDASLLRELQSYSKKGDIHKINLENAKKIATLRSKFMIERQFSIGTLPTFKLNVNCSLEEFESFLEDRRFRFQFLASIYLVNGIVATPPADHITFQLIELTEKLDGEKDAKSILQFVVCEYNNYMGGFRPTPSLDPYEPGGFFAFPKMEFPLPSWFGSVFIMKGHSESYKTLGEVEFTSGLLKVMATRLLKNFSVKNYMKDIPKRQPYLEAPMVLFGEGPRSREILETALGTHLGEFRALLTSSLGSQLRVLMPPGTTTLVHNWSALSKVGLWFFIAIVELQMGLVDEGRVSFRKARQFMRFIIRKMGEAGRVKVDLVLKDTDGVFSLKRLLGYYVTLVNYEEAIVLRLIVRKMLDYRETYDSHGEAKTTKHQELLKAWDLSNAEHFDDHQEWQRWLRIKESNLDLMTSLMI